MHLKSATIPADGVTGCSESCRPIPDRESDTTRFSYPADHPRAVEFEEQMFKRVWEYMGDGELLAVHHPTEPDAHDDAPAATALALMAGACGKVPPVSRGLKPHTYR